MHCILSDKYPWLPEHTQASGYSPHSDKGERKQRDNVTAYMRDVKIQCFKW